VMSLLCSLSLLSTTSLSIASSTLTFWALVCNSSTYALYGSCS
jgi:hypothetical protein